MIESFYPPPIHYSKLYAQLKVEGLIVQELPYFVPNPPPKWYDDKEVCIYHGRILGHR